MVEFGGWLMPLQYSSMRAEHQAVRQGVGIFDVSHMGQFRVRGRGATGALERVVTNRVSDLAVGQARYTMVCNQAGGIIDDALVYRHGDDHFVVVVNAGPRIKDLAHIQEAIGADCPVEDLTGDMALLAVQGPRAVDVLQPLSNFDLAAVGYYHFRQGQLDGIEAGFSRTGYTGEDGFELFVDRDDAVAAWDRVISAGAQAGITPCGLGARDTLRLEAAMRLSGQDISEETNPLEAGLGWAVKLDKGDFIGREALLRIKEAGPRRAFVGLAPEDRAIARHGDSIRDGTRLTGEVTSGTYSFTLDRAVAMGYVERGSRESSSLSVEVRGTTVGASVVALPFYQRSQG
jgi:aminomethyltransferase